MMLYSLIKFQLVIISGVFPIQPDVGVIHGEY
jgi:hypothetical protein